MRIAIICSDLVRGGAETQLVALGSALQAMGHPVLVLTLATVADKVNVERLRAAGVEVVEHSKRSRLDIAVLRQLRSRLKAFRPDIIHGFLFDGNLYSRLAGLGMGVPILASERASHYTLRRAQLYGHRLTRWLSDGLVANSYAGAAFAAGMYPALSKDRIHVLWNGIDQAAVERRTAVAQGLRDRLQVPKDARLLCFVAMIKPEKDVLLALQTAKLLFAREGAPWHLVLVGAAYPKVSDYKVVEYEESMEYDDQVTVAMSKLPAGRVHRLGLIDDVIETMAQCDVIMSTSVREGFPNVVLEGMASGTPVVSTRYSDIERILPLSWQVVQSRLADDLADAITKAEDEAATVVAAQREWVAEHADIGRAAQKLLEIYLHHLQLARTA